MQEPGTWELESWWGVGSGSERDQEPCIAVVIVPLRVVVPLLQEMPRRTCDGRRIAGAVARHDRTAHRGRATATETTRRTRGGRRGDRHRSSAVRDRDVALESVVVEVLESVVVDAVVALKPVVRNHIVVLNCEVMGSKESPMDGSGCHKMWLFYL